VCRTEHDGRIVTLADSFQGKRLNSPNDIVCKSDGSIWFTDPSFGILGYYEGEKVEPELPTNVYRIAPDGTLRRGRRRHQPAERIGVLSQTNRSCISSSRARCRARSTDTT
jgi:sugar lactone lactonase YvrE